MKRIIILLFVVIVLFSACYPKYTFEVGESMNDINDKHSAYIVINALSVYKIRENFVITIDDGATIKKLVEFSYDRKCIRAQEVDLLETGDINQFISIRFDALTEKIGQPHVDIGSGFYIPSYITNDAHLVCFEIENEIVVEIIKRDLLTNKIVDRKAINPTEIE